MSAQDPDFAAVERRVDAILADLARADGGAVSFAAADPEVADLADLLAEARGEPTALHFSGGGRLAALQGEFAGFVRRVWRELTHLAIVDTRSAGRVVVHTRVGWAGDSVCVVARDAGRERLQAHAAAVEAAVHGFGRRLRLLATIAATAGKISVMLASPAAAFMALPVAYKCVRDVYEQWTVGRP